MKLTHKILLLCKMKPHKRRFPNIGRLIGKLILDYTKRYPLKMMMPHKIKLWHQMSHFELKAAL